MKGCVISLTVLMVRCEFMFQPSAYHRPHQPARPCFTKMRWRAQSVVLLLSAASALVCGAEDLPSRLNATFAATKAAPCVTNVAQFRTLSGVDYLAGCDFRLTGVVTLVDTNRDLVVLQDATGAVALNFRAEDRRLQVGQLVTFEGAN